MTFLLTASLVWSLLAVPVALLVSRGVRLADGQAQAPFHIDDVEQYLREQPATPRV